MKYALALALPLYFGCAAPKVVEKPSPIIVEITPTTEGDITENDPFLEEEIPFKKVVRMVTGSFTQLLRQQKKETLEGTIYFENSDHLFEYHYEPLPFCEPDSKEKYAGKITLEYYSSQEIEGKKITTLTTLTDVAPFGSIDRVELFVDGTVQIPFYANYEANTEAQQLQEALFRHIYQVLDQHSQLNAAWENFESESITKDTKWHAYKVHHELLQSLLAQDSLPWEKLKIYNPCEL